MKLILECCEKTGDERLSIEAGNSNCYTDSSISTARKRLRCETQPNRTDPEPNRIEPTPNRAKPKRTAPHRTEPTQHVALRLPKKRPAIIGRSRIEVSATSGAVDANMSNQESSRNAK